MAKYSKHQQNIIRNYYEHRDEIALQRLSECVGELYLAQGKAREKVWKSIRGSLKKLKIPATEIENLVAKDNPALVAKVVERLWGKQ